MNKKAMLLAEETLKMIIALIGISFLVYLLFSIYFSSVGGQKKQYADATLSRIMEIVENAESEIEDIKDPTPFGWFLFGFVGDEKKPNPCSNKNCLCICYNIKINVFDRQIKECGNKGSCGIIENLRDFDDLKFVKGGQEIEISKQGGEIIILEK